MDAVGRVRLSKYLKFYHALAKSTVFHMLKNFGTPLHAAAENTGTDMVKLLIENGANINNLFDIAVHCT